MRKAKHAKKANHKRVVAMTLALSMLTSSAGMCGAAAAEGAPGADGSDLQVTIVPLSEGDSAPAEPVNDAKTSEQPAGNSEDPAEGTENPAENEQPAASTDGNTDQSTEGDGDGDGDNTSSDDEPTIERPEQSDTVETLPGSAEDNIEHIKGEDGEDPGETGDGETGSTEETPETPEEKTEEKTEEKSEETPEEKTEEKTGETPEEKPEETPAEDNTDYSCAYDPDTGHFKITFNIKEDAEGDQTIELSKVQDVVKAYGKQAVEEYLKTEEAQKKYDDYLYYKLPFICTLPSGLQYSYNPRTGEINFTEEPGCTTVFDVSLANGSKHTYVYKNNSLTVSTPDLAGKGDSGVTGFDGQELPSDITRKDLSLSVSMDASVSGCMEDLVDKALKEYGTTNQFRVDNDGNVTTTTKTTVPKGTELVKLADGKLYVKAGDYYYGGINANNSAVGKDENGNYYLKKDKTNVSCTAYTEDGKAAYRPVERGGKGTLTATQGEIQSALRKYLQNNDTTIEQAILDYYNNGSDVAYDSISDLLANNTEAAKELSKGGASLSQRISVDSNQFYNNFYQNILSFNVGDSSDIDESSQDHGHGHGSWASDGSEMTIGDYMAGKLDETPGAWAKANSYFNTLLASGMTANEATWAAFTMATNIDGLRADNNYQSTAWSWYASMVLHQADGTLNLTKKDAETDETIGDDEGEGQTSFYLWKYETETDADGNETQTPMYCTYVEPTYSTNADGEQVLEKDGFYCWVKYDPAQDKLNYTITTTGGSLNIDYALLEDVVYYLQEAIAPEGYDADPNIYVICDQETYDQLAASGAFDSVENPAEGTSSPVAGWLGAIKGGDTLTINFVNTASVPDPEPEPIPDPVIPPVDPIDPVNPDNPVSPANPDLPPVQDATPDPESPVLPQNPENPAVLDARPDAAVLPQTGTTDWLAGVLMSFGSALLAGGWFFTRRQRAPKR